LEGALSYNLLGVGRRRDEVERIGMSWMKLEGIGWSKELEEVQWSGTFGDPIQQKRP